MASLQRSWLSGLGTVGTVDRRSDLRSFTQLKEYVSLVEAPSKGVVFVFGRFNPPTAGHEVLVNKARQVANEEGIYEVRLYTSFSQDRQRNPLTHEEKVEYLRKFFGMRVRVMVEPDAVSPFHVARLISDEGIKRVVMVAGSDRVAEFQTKIGNYVNHPDPEKSYDFDSFKVVSAGERDPDEEGVEGLSASKLRIFAKDGGEANFQKFKQGLPKQGQLIGDRGSRLLFTAVRRGMGLQESFQNLVEVTFQKLWFNIKTQKWIEVPASVYDHLLDVRHRPEVYGLKNSDVDFSKTLAWAPKIEKLMFPRGWTRIVRQDVADFSIQAFDLESAWIASQSVSKKFGTPEEIYLDFVKGNPNHAAIRRNQVSAFLKTGKIVPLSAMASFHESSQMVVERSDAAFIERLKSYQSPDEAEKGKCYSVRWADGRGIAAYRNRGDAIKFIAQGDRDPVQVAYGPDKLPSGKSLIVRNKFTPDRSSIAEEWPDQSLPNKGFWLNIKTKNWVLVPSKKEHYDLVEKQPDIFGLKKSQIKGVDDRDLEEMIFEKGWVRFVVTQARENIESFDIDTYDIESAFIAAQLASKKFGVPKSIFMDFRVGMPRMTTLKGNQVKTFINTGKIVPISSLAAFRDHFVPNVASIDEDFRLLLEVKMDKYWFDTKKKKWNKVQLEFHDWDVVVKPALYGLTKDDVAHARKQMEGGNDTIEALEKLLMSKGWAQVTIFQRSGLGGRPSGEQELDIRAYDMKAAAATAKDAAQHSANVTLMYVRLREPRKTIEFEANQIKAFMNTGKIVAKSAMAAFRESLAQVDEAFQDLVEASQYKKFWFHVKTKKLSLVPESTVFHDWDVVKRPVVYGLAKVDVMKAKKKMDDGNDEIPEIKKLMFENGWARGAVVNGKELDIHAADLESAHVVAWAAFKKYGEFERIMVDLQKGSPKFAILIANQVITFIKTGKVVPQSSVATFR